MDRGGCALGVDGARCRLMNFQFPTEPCTRNLRQIDYHDSKGHLIREVTRWHCHHSTMRAIFRLQCIARRCGRYSNISG